MSSSIIFLLLLVVNTTCSIVYPNGTVIDSIGQSEDLKRQLVQLRMNKQNTDRAHVKIPQKRFFILFGVFRSVFSVFKNIFAGLRENQLTQEIIAELKEIKELLYDVNDKIDQLADQVNNILRSIEQNHDVTRVASIFGDDILRLKYFMRFISNPIFYDENNQIIINTRSKSWARAVLSFGYDGIDQILFNFHCMITGCITKPILDVSMDGMLIAKRSDIWQRMDGIIETLIEMQKIGYICWAIALDIEDISEEKETWVQPILEERLSEQDAILKIDERLKTWPAGSYGFVRAKTGCPSGTWRSGDYFHDTEDAEKKNRGSSDYNKYIMAYVNDDMKWFFCLKYKNSGIIEWPAGKYCMFKYGPCPAKFSVGYIYFDDEDHGNDNKRNGYVPDGTYGRDTRYYFCCRSDGSVNNQIVLPINRPFVLFPLHRNSCQKVYKMRVRELYLYWNCEDNNNHNRRQPPYPKETNQGPDMQIYMCHYEADV